MKYKIKQQKQTTHNERYRDFELGLEIFDNDMKERKDYRQLIVNFIHIEHGFHYDAIHSRVNQTRGYMDPINKCSEGGGGNLIEWVVYEDKIHIWNRLQKDEDDPYDEVWVLNETILEIARKYVELFEVYDEELGYTLLTDEIFEVEDAIPNE